MKNYIAGLFLAFTFTTASASELPADILPATNSFAPAVSQVLTFNSDFPESESAKWSAGEGKVFVEFINKDQIRSYAIYKNGELQETYYGIDINSIPTISKSHLNTKYPEHQIENAFMVRDKAGAEKYLVELKGTDDVLYSKDGYLLRYVK